MAECRFCDHRNPPGKKSCEKCGAELPFAPAQGEAAVAALESRGDLSDTDREVLRIYAAEGKLAAIKRYREVTRQGLKESKQAVEELANRVGVKPGSGGSGCAAMLVAMVATACLLAVKFAAG